MSHWTEANTNKFHCLVQIELLKIGSLKGKDIPAHRILLINTI